MIAALLHNNLAMTSPYWCPPSRLCLLLLYFCVFTTWYVLPIVELRARMWTAIDDIYNNKKWVYKYIYFHYSVWACCNHATIPCLRIVIDLLQKSHNALDKYPTKRRPVAYITQCIRQISHNAPFYNRNVHICAHFCYKMVHCGIWYWCSVGFVN